MIHPNYQALIDFVIGSLEKQGKFPSQSYIYIDEEGNRCVIGLLLPERIIEGLEPSCINYCDKNKEALEYISNTFGLPNTPIFENILSSMQVSFDIMMTNHKKDDDFLTAVLNYKDTISKYIARYSKYEFN